MSRHLPRRSCSFAYVACVAFVPWLHFAPGLQAQDAAPPPANAVSVVSDDFERAGLAPWTQNCKTFSIEGGVLKGSQTRDDHGAVSAIEAHFGDAVIQFRFRFEGATSISAVCDDKSYAGSHAGHICRVTITPKLIRLGDDREGGMRNDIMEMRRDPKRKAEGDKLMEGRIRAFPHAVEPHRWYTLTMRLTGDEMHVALDGRLVGSLKSPGFAHPTKSHFHFTVNGRDALFDDVRITSLAPGAR